MGLYTLFLSSVEANKDQALDVAHMVCLQRSYNVGFGRHLYFLTLPQFSQALKWQVAPQDLRRSSD
jgi:hypothetical protein